MTAAGVHHVALRTKDVPRLERFYEGAIGLMPRTRNGERSVWLAAGTTLVMIEQRETHEPELPPGSMDLVAFAIEPSARASHVERLAAHGVAIEQETAFTVYFRDPDGRRVALSHYPEPAEPAA